MVTGSGFGFIFRIIPESRSLPGVNSSSQVMLNQSLIRLQKVRRKLACCALLPNPMQPRLAPHSEVLWLRVTERSAVLFETVPSAILLSRAGVNRSGSRMQSLRTGVAPFYFGHNNKKVTQQSNGY